MSAPSLPNLWANCVNQLKDRINNRSFWEAIEATSALTIEGGVLVIGMPSEEMSQASFILQASTFHAVGETVREVFQQPLMVRIIEGTTLEDWESAKQLDVRKEAAKTNPVFTPQEKLTFTGGTTWDMVADQMSRHYAQAPFRALPQGKARFANEALYMLLDAMESLYVNEGDEQTERALARLLDRIANASEIPAAVLAFELERLRAWRRDAPAAPDEF